LQPYEISNLDYSWSNIIHSLNIKGLRHWVARILGSENRVCGKDSIPLWRNQWYRI